MKLFLRKSGIFAILFVMANLFFAGTAFGQTLTSDQPDYAPGANAILTGSGFAPNEIVKLQVMHADDILNDGEEHFHWDVTADADGNFETNWHVCEDDCLGSTLKATADGQTSALHAEVIFTDANPTPVSITTLGSTYSQNFNGLLPSGNGSTGIPAGWGFIETGSGINPNSNYTAGTGSGNAGDTYSFGASGNFERALGGLQSGSVVPFIGFAFTNNTGVAITSLRVSYTGEQWRLGSAGRVDQLDFQYLVGATSLTIGTWTDVNSLDFTAPVTAGTAGALDGNNAANRTAKAFNITGLSIANGATVWFRWTDFDATGSEDGLAIDDFSLIADPTVDYANLQSPASATITPVGSVIVYARVYEPGVTPNASFDSSITAWIGYSSSNVNPSDASFTWISATFNAQYGNDDEYQALLGSLPPGTYYYASRFQLNGGSFKYGGLNFGFWNASTNPSGVLTVTNPTVDFANLQSPSTATITTSGSVNVFARVFEPGVTQNASFDPSITAWIGYSSSNVNPSDASFTWIPATFNAQYGNDDEYQATLGPLPSGTYYYASRFQLNGGSYSYGGLGNFWNSTTNPSGVLTVTCFTATPTGSTSQSFNNSANVSNLVASGTGVQWFDTASSTTPLSPSTPLVNGNHYFASSTVSGCESARLDVTVTIVITQVDFANVQFPSSVTINTGGLGVIVYARVFEPGVTLNAGEQISSITAWIGYSSSNVAPNDPSFTWIPATYNVQVGNDDEYQATIGSTLPAGTYYYASRFQLTGGPYSYGGLGNFWNASSNPSGVLTVNCTTPAARTIASSGETIFCTGGSVILTSSVATGNIWSNGATTPSITVNSSGTYTVSYVDSFGCPSAVSAPVVVTVNPVIAATKVVTPPLCAGGNGTVVVSATGGNGTYTGTGTFTVVAGAPYSFTVTDGFCTSNILSGTMASPTIVVATETHTAIACFGGSSTVTIAATGGTGTYSNGTGTFSQTAGTQSYTVTDSNGCSASVSVTITQPTLLVATTTQTDVNCFGGNTGAIDLTVSGGTAFNTGGTVNYTQNFDSLAASGTSSAMPSGWFFVESDTNANTSYAAGTGSSPTGDTYSFGTTSDRALGTLFSSSLSSIIGAGSTFINTTGVTVTSLSIQYTGEQWRLGTTGRADRLDFQYSTNATAINNGTWIDVNTLDFSSPITTGTTGALNGNLAANRATISNTISGLSIPNGSSFWIRWSDLDASGADDGLGIDDFSISMNSSANPYTYSWTGTGVNPTAEDQTGLTAGTYNVVVTDKNGCQASPTAITLVVNDTQIPVITSNGDQNVNNNLNVCGATVTVSATATDNCSVGTPIGVRSDLLALNAVYPVGPTTITWNVSDSNGNPATAVIQTVIVTDNQAPVADALSLASATGECSATITSAPTATDNCNGTILVTTTDSLTRTTQGTSTVTWTFTDVVGNSSTQTQDIVVTDVTAPVADAISLASATGECSATITSVPTAIDNCNGTILGTTTDSLTRTTQGTSTVTWTFTDAVGNSSTQTQDIVVIDVTAPVADAISLASATGECSATITSVPTATDNCNGIILGTTTDSLTRNTQGTSTVTWTFIDAVGNSSTQTQDIVVIDVTAPVADAISLASATGECSATITSVPTATDNCNGIILGTTTDSLTRTTQGTSTVTWTFTDAVGNSSTQTQDIVVKDVIAPVADASSLASATGECSATITSVPTATDNCNGTILGTTTDTLTRNTQGTSTVTWTFTDAVGNSSTQTQDIVVIDVTAPVADALSLASATGECSATITSVPTATDNCNGTILGTTTDTLTRNTQGTSTVTWTFTDAVGNSSTQTQDIVVTDVTAPVANVASLATVTGECSASVTAPTATDNCAGVISATTTNPTTYTAQGTYIVTWTYSDGNGNTSSQNQTVIVKDITAPSIVCPANIILSACQPIATWSTPTGSDNCSGFSVMRTGPASGSTFANGSTTTITYTVTDVGGNATTCSFTVTRQAALALAVTNSNPQLYYGYTLDQSTTIKGTPSGGVGPYKVVITMNRVLACNVLNSAGDETWTASAGGSSTGNTCPGSGPGTTPVSTNLTVPVGGFYSVTSILLSNATFTVTVTDANNCVVSATTNVYSEDARCFAGNTNIVKVKICHKTGNSKDPCHELCVSESAVAAHIAHGDYIGACLANCVDPVVHTKHVEQEAVSIFKVIGYPNPSKNQFTVDVLSDSNEKVEVAVYDMLARLVRRFESSSKSSPIRFGEDLPSGEYLTVVKQGENIKVLNLIKQ